MEGRPLDTPYRGGFVGREHHFALTVYFEDTDTAGVVYYANYLKFMERARSDMIRAVGIDQSAMLRGDGSAYFVTHVDIRYRRPSRLGDDLRIVSTVVSPAVRYLWLKPPLSMIAIRFTRAADEPVSAT